MAAAKQPSPRRGGVDTMDGKQIAGWAIDLSQPNKPLSLVLLADGHPLGMFGCHEVRPDVNAHGGSGAPLGFRIDLPDALLDGKPHRLAVRFRTGEVLHFHPASGSPQEEIVFTHHLSVVAGVVDGMFGSAVRGWAVRTDTRTGDKTGCVTLEVWTSGIKLGQVKADQIRNDVAEIFGCQPQCGFLYSLPTRFRDGSPFVLEFRPASEAGQIDGSPFSGSVLARDSIGQLHSMLARVESLCTQAYALKDQLKQLLLADEYSLNTYHAWAIAYVETLRARVVAERQSQRYADLIGGQDIKVSILCPTYKPSLADFVQAVESVRRQSWSNWELVIVDDGSRSPALTEVIDEFVAADSRIRCVTLRKNQGISAATNAAIAAATGDWIALFDHDDLLVDVAIEVMLLAARNTGARVLYSDEDKIDSFGMFSEPHLKSDWNYRLLLTNNYVCHFLMVEAATLRGVGPLDTKYDGAQDHDLILRLSEAVPPAQIHHVPEILYHWRKAARSTASQTSAKPYAVQAGIAAVRDHVIRKGLPAEVVSPFQGTVYDVRWQFTAEPRVAILIPFKDKVELTRRCVERLLEVTRYRNYEIVLIDNWSTEPATLEWLATLRDEKRVRMIRIEEPFNFSRINNLAVRQLDVDALLFLNNDIFVEQPDWLRLMVNEALADPKVGIVGVKLVYPNQTVQHAGVVLGVGGVGDHMFRSEERDAAGYMYRALVAQDLSAVTAACMLCRMDAFRAVGGFDEARLTVAFNDVDLCLKIGRTGYRIVFTPAVVAEHHESISRGNDLAAHNLPRFYSENQLMADRWADLLRSDPYYNPHFSHESGIFRVLSNASLDVARAPSLLHRPPPRATLTDPPALASPSPASHTEGGRRQPAAAQAARSRASRKRSRDLVGA